MNDDVAFPPVQLGDLTTNDRDLTGGSTPGDIISFRQREKESGEHCTSVGPSFQDSRMYPLRILAFRADLDFLTKKLFPGVNNQRPNVLPNIKHSMFAVNPVNLLFDHVLCSPLGCI